MKSSISQDPVVRFEWGPRILKPHMISWCGLKDVSGKFLWTELQPSLCFDFFTKFWKKWSFQSRWWLILSPGRPCWELSCKRASTAQSHMACRDETLLSRRAILPRQRTNQVFELSQYIYGWTHEIEQRSGSSHQIWVRISHPEATYGILVWCKRYIWENSVDRDTALSLIHISEPTRP